jgi:hypothetical protein
LILVFEWATHDGAAHSRKNEFSFLNPILVVVPGLADYFACVAEINSSPSTSEIELRKHRRSDMKKFLTILGLLTVIATPAFAQSFTHDYGTGNIINVPALEQSARTDASSAFAQAPKKHVERKAPVDRYSPALTGGGNEGYNWELENDF